MKIYFAGSIRGGRDDAVLYGEIIKLLEKHGTVLTEHVGDPKITGLGENLPTREIHDRDLNWLSESQAIVAEVTVNSLGVGYELGVAVSLKKPVLCVFRPEVNENISPMLSGSPGVELIAYQRVLELPKIFAEFLSKVPTALG